MGKQTDQTRHQLGVAVPKRHHQFVGRKREGRGFQLAKFKKKKKKFTLKQQRTTFENDRFQSSWALFQFWSMLFRTEEAFKSCELNPNRADSRHDSHVEDHSIAMLAYAVSWQARCVKKSAGANSCLRCATKTLSKNDESFIHVQCAPFSTPSWTNSRFYTHNIVRTFSGTVILQIFVCD